MPCRCLRDRAGGWQTKTLGEQRRGDGKVCEGSPEQEGRSLVGVYPEGQRWGFRHVAGRERLKSFNEMRQSDWIGCTISRHRKPKSKFRSTPPEASYPAFPEAVQVRGPLGVIIWVTNGHQTMHSLQYDLT